MNRISRRNFLKAAGVGAAALGLSACGRHRKLEPHAGDRRIQRPAGAGAILDRV